MDWQDESNTIRLILLLSAAAIKLVQRVILNTSDRRP